MKKTKWFESNLKPSLAGVYQRDYRVASGDRDAGITYSHWNGRHWGLYGETPEQAVVWAGHYSSYQGLPWRGLASNPKKAKPC